mmetsp:Transcript_33789/g.74412  ORF Transcript_33789/g.74412 Transcript_33789/m.74412 type:complete len:257 (+) Transcript_33789:1580-2350(+)
MKRAPPRNTLQCSAAGAVKVLAAIAGPRPQGGWAAASLPPSPAPALECPRPSYLPGRTHTRRTPVPPVPALERRAPAPSPPPLVAPPPPVGPVQGRSCLLLQSSAPPVWPCASPATCASGHCRCSNARLGLCSSDRGLGPSRRQTRWTTVLGAASPPPCPTHPSRTQEIAPPALHTAPRPVTSSPPESYTCPPGPWRCTPPRARRSRACLRRFWRQTRCRRSWTGRNPAVLLLVLPLGQVCWTPTRSRASRLCAGC